jgi:NTP pyrophosphatase (non-canonical NTP hydrolase)
MLQPERLFTAVQQVHGDHDRRQKWVEGDDGESLAAHIKHEAGELVEAVTECILSGDVWKVASEVADLLILLFRFCEEFGLDAADLITMKNKRNARKYDDHTLNNGYKPQEATAIAKESWAYKAPGQTMSGDIAFSWLYLDVLAEV